MSGNADPEILYEFEKPRATVRAYIDEFHGKRYAHIREFVEPRDQPGADLIPTSKGISVPAEYVPELLEAAQALAAAMTATARPAGGGKRRAA